MVENLSLRNDFVRCIHRADFLSLPVRFLWVVWDNYSFEYGASSASMYFFQGNTIHLSRYVIDTILNHANLNTGSHGINGLPSEFGTFYHEFTHGWIRLKEEQDNRRVDSLRNFGDRYYRNAPLTNGHVASHPDRIYNEAMAEYVAWRISQWLQCLENLNSLKAVMNRESVPTLSQRRKWLSRLKQIKSEYEGSGGMGHQTFGYEETGPLGWFGTQVETTKPIDVRMSSYCDRELLENKISSFFSQSGRPYQIWSNLRERLPVPEW